MACTFHIFIQRVYIFWYTFHLANSYLMYISRYSLTSVMVRDFFPGESTNGVYIYIYNCVCVCESGFVQTRHRCQFCT